MARKGSGFFDISLLRRQLRSIIKLIIGHLMIDASFFQAGLFHLSSSRMWPKFGVYSYTCGTVGPQKPCESLTFCDFPLAIRLLSCVDSPLNTT